MSVAVRADFDYAIGRAPGLAPARWPPSTSAIAREFFAAKGVHVDLIKLYGSMELAPLTGLADAIVDLVSTGNTLKANHLVEVERIMDISARLVVNQAALKLKQAPIRRIIDAFATAIPPPERYEPDSLARPPVDRRQPTSKPISRRGCTWSAEADAAIEQRGGGHPGRRAAARRCGGARVHAPLRPAAARPHGGARTDAGRTASRLRRAARGAARRAAKPPPRRVRSYHEAQKKASGESWSYRDADGTLLGQKVTPLDRVGIYVPGGKAAYPSSVLMNAIPAHVAGVGEIIMVVPTPGGEKNALVLAAATWPA